MIARASGDRSAAEPPSAALMSEYFDLQELVLSGAVYRDEAGQMSGGSEPEADAGVAGAGQMSGGLVRQRLNLREDLALWWRALRDLYGLTGVSGSFVRWLCLCFWRSWVDTLGGAGPWAEIYARDRYRCSSPVCDRRDITPHHLLFRGRGGGDEESNLSSLCVRCHLEGVHLGRIRAEGSAPDVSWWIGRTPVLEVRGRAKVLVGPAVSE